MDLPYFDITKQLPQDVMHVLFEGLFPLNMELLLTHLIDILNVSLYVCVVCIYVVLCIKKLLCVNAYRKV